MEVQLRSSISHPSTDCLDRERYNTTALTETFLYCCVTFDIFLLVSVAFINSLVITAIVRYRRYHTGTIRAYYSSTSMKFVLNLAASDLLTGVGGFMFALTRYYCDFNQLFCGNRYLCLMKFVPSFFGQVSSGLSLIAIAVDRYVAVFHSFQYRTIMTDRTCHVLILALWVLAFIITHSLYFWNIWGPKMECTLQNVAPLSFILFVDSFFHMVVLILIGGIHYKLHRKACETSSQQIAIVFKDTRKNIKSVKLVVLVIGVYFICWLPLSLLHVIGAVTRNEESIYFYYAVRIVQPLRNVYIVINPFIYAWKNLEVRDSIKWFFKRQSRPSTVGSRIEKWRGPREEANRVAAHRRRKKNDPAVDRARSLRRNGGHPFHIHNPMGSDSGFPRRTNESRPINNASHPFKHFSEISKGFYSFNK